MDGSLPIHLIWRDILQPIRISMLVWVDILQLSI